MNTIICCHRIGTQTQMLSVHKVLHQASASTLRQLCDDASDSVLIENNGVTQNWSCNPILNDPIVFH